jgi:hypothetical protein
MSVYEETRMLEWELAKGATGVRGAGGDGVIFRCAALQHLCGFLFPGLSRGESS